MSKKRVHEIAKEHGLSSKELLEKLKAAGIEAKAAASSVEETAALSVLGTPAPSAQASSNAASTSGTRLIAVMRPTQPTTNDEGGIPRRARSWSSTATGRRGSSPRSPRPRSASR